MSALRQLADIGITPRSMTTDSRKVEAGDLFLAYPGESTDGRTHIAQAIDRGACAVLWEKEGGVWNENWPVANLPVSKLREQAGELAAEFYENPSQNLWMIGITGTNGKTSCSHWLAQSLTSIGNKTAVIGTLGNGYPGALSEAVNTTPDPIQLQAMLAQFAEQNADAIAMEVSSHGLEQGRANGVKFDIAVLTNLSRDHLDYHGSMEAYSAAKEKLFDWPNLKCAVLNADDALGARLALKLIAQGKRVLTYGLDGGSVSCTSLRLQSTSLSMEVMTPQGKAELSANIIGRFNASNLLAVLATLLASDIPLQKAIAALEQIRPVPGRMQQAGGNGKPLVVVDYAHTPDALAKALYSLREQTQGQLICVFGCGGNRDKGKRPLMGEVSSSLADSSIVTSDNPRHETVQSIIEDIVAGMSGKYAIEPDRSVAIQQAIRSAKPEDVILIAGKGHENYQQIGDEKLPFNDLEVAEQVLQELAA